MENYSKYVASNNGIIKSAGLRATILKTYGKNEKSVSVQNDQKVKGRVKISLLIALAFLPGTGKVVLYKNGNKLDCRIENLKWKEEIILTHQKLDEIWKDLPGFDKLKISNYGIIISHKSKMNPQEIGKVKGTKFKSVRLRNKGTHETYGLEYLIALAFISNPKKFKYVMHKNNNLHDNSVENLAWWPNPDGIDEEVWVPVDKFPNYEISPFGIRNVQTKRMLKPTINVFDYPYVTLYNGDGKNHILKVHRLVVLHFVKNLDPETKDIVNYSDGDKMNHHPNNLEWMTQSENQNN